MNYCRPGKQHSSPIVLYSIKPSIRNQLLHPNPARPYSDHLHAGLFTKNLSKALKLANQIEAGGVMINDSSDYRFDAMPFGGLKYGSLGREGVRFAYEDITQPKVVCINYAWRA